MNEATAKGTLVGFTAASNGNPVIGTLITVSDGAQSYTTHSVVLGSDMPSGFRLELPPGTYLVKADFEGGFFTGEQAGVVIKPSRDTEVTLTLKLPK